MSASLENKIALVTGASRGIGAEIAINLAKKGALVIGTATSSKGTEFIKQAFEVNKLTGFGLELNVTNNDSISQLIMISMAKLIFLLTMQVLQKILY